MIDTTSPFKNATDELRKSAAFQRAKEASKGASKPFVTPPGTKEWVRSMFYDIARKEYLILNGKGDWYSVAESQLKRQCKIKGVRVKPEADSLTSEFERLTVELQDFKGVAYAGPLAGHCKGPREVNGALILVTREPVLIQPEKGEWTFLTRLLEGMFRDSQYDQLTYLYGWLQSAIKSLMAHTRKPGQVLVIAGQAECGKSLLQTIITWILGDRECKPYSYMTGRTDFNSELFAAEHLRLDDEQSTTDMRSRRAFGSRIKELLFGHAQRLHGKHRDALTLDPTWRMTVSLNEEPESMQVLPPLDESLEDKIIILKAAKKPMPMPTGTAEQTAAFAAKLRSELPAFVHWLLNEFEIPSALRNERCGIAHWHHPELLAALRELSSEAMFLSLIDRELFHRQALVKQWEGSAIELEQLLRDVQSSVRQEAAKIISWPTACGVFLSRIAHALPDRVEQIRSSSERRWIIHPPAENS